MNAGKPDRRPLLFIIGCLLVVSAVLLSFIPWSGPVKVSKTGKVLDFERNEVGDAEVVIEGLTAGTREGVVMAFVNDELVPWGSIDASPFLKTGKIFLYDENCFIRFQ